MTWLRKQKADDCQSLARMYQPTSMAQTASKYQGAAATACNSIGLEEATHYPLQNLSPHLVLTPELPSNSTF